MSNIMSEYLDQFMDDLNIFSWLKLKNTQLEFEIQNHIYGYVC